MNYEDKYNEALKRAKQALKDGTITNTAIAYIQDIFPELKESEGEKIRKWCVNLIKTTCDYDSPTSRKEVDDAIAWLEKQGELKLQGKTALEAIKEEKVDNQNCIKPADKIKSKFHPGDWVVQENIGVFRVIEVCESWYEVVDGKDRQYSIGFDKEYMCHIWTIADAEKGDVLVCKGNVKNVNEVEYEKICLFNNLSNAFFILTKYSNFVEDYDIINVNIDYPNNTIPATLKQREILFMAMKEAGFKWDDKKKELKKIEDEIEIPFDAKDSELQEATYYIPKGFHAEIDDDKVVIKKGEKPTTWSEEDGEK